MYGRLATVCGLVYGRLATVCELVHDRLATVDMVGREANGYLCIVGGLLYACV